MKPFIDNLPELPVPEWTVDMPGYEVRMLRLGNPKDYWAVLFAQQPGGAIGVLLRTDTVISQKLRIDRSDFVWYPDWAKANRNTRDSRTKQGRPVTQDYWDRCIKYTENSITRGNASPEVEL